VAADPDQQRDLGNRQRDEEEEEPDHPRMIAHRAQARCPLIEKQSRPTRNRLLTTRDLDLFAPDASGVLLP
jgi:hypothetical protein